MKVPYTPNQLPYEPSRLAAALEQETAALKEGLEAPWDYSEQRYLAVEPSMLRPGMQVLADGTNWNPGSGAGLYLRNEANTTWQFIGPLFKTKKVTGTTPAVSGTDTAVAHGVTLSKIISMTGIVQASASLFVTQGGISAAGYSFGIYADATNVLLNLHATDSANIQSKPFSVLIVYEE